MNKILISWVVCVLALVLLLAGLGSGLVGTPPDTGERGLLRAQYELESVKGKVTLEDFAGKYQLIYFGFTHCPDLCPTTLIMMQNALNDLGGKAAKVVPILITIDPERDTPKVVADYAVHFGKTMVGLTGTEAQIKTAEDNFKVYASKVSGKVLGDPYTMDHSGFIYLVGPDGTYVTHFSADVGEKGLTEGLRQYVK